MKSKMNFKEMSNEDLNNRLKEISEEILSAKMKFRVGQFKRTSEFPRLRREAARIKTQLRARILSAKGAA